MQKVWRINKADIRLQEELKKNLKISSVLAQLLINRNITTPKEAEAFLKADISNLHESSLLPDIDKAAIRIRRALKNKEKVLIFSDYDADGITALAVLKIAFDRLGLIHEHYLPHRIKEGYGLSPQFVSYAKEKASSLIITLDCGVTNFKEIEALNKQGIDTIVVDHHQPKGSDLPKAYAIINPKRSDSKYPYRDLAGVGLSYKLATSLLDCSLEEELDLVCLGTIADVVPLTGENRIIVKEGLKRLNNTKRPGLKSLIELAGIKNREIGPEYVGYILGPRLNACGRLGSCESALKLLLCQELSEALVLAKELHLKNQERQRIEGRIMDEALGRVEKEVDFLNERVIVLHQEGWHRGVLGIVAAKIADKFYRPTIVISFDNGVGKGSARSIESFHLFESLIRCQEHLLSFGGHAHAAGLSILKENIGIFKESINKIAGEQLTGEDLLPSLNIDYELDLSDLGHELLNEIALLEPFGQENLKPLFSSRGLEIKSKPVILGRDTLKFWVSNGRGTYPAVGFGLGSYFDLVAYADKVDLAYHISLDNWNGNNQVQLEIEDIRLSS